MSIFRALIVFAVLLASASLQGQETVLHEGPTLIIDPGMHTAPIKRMDVDAAGAVVVTGADDRTVRIWSVADGRLLRTLHVPTGPGNVGKIYAVAISPDGGTVAAGGWTRWTREDPQQQLYLFNRDDGAMIHRIAGLPDVVHHLAFSTDGSRLAATLGGSNGVRVYGRDDGWAELWRDEAYDGDSYGAAFAADGRLATTSYDGDIRLYDRDGTRIARRASGHARPYGIAFHPEGDRIAVGFDDSTDVALFDGRDLTPLPGPDTGLVDNGNLGNVAWSRDGVLLYAGGGYHVEGMPPVLAWGGAGAGPPRRLDAGQNTVISLRGLPDGGLLVAAGDPWLGRLSPAGEQVWDQAHGSPKMDARRQLHNFGVSADGMIVDFGYDVWGRRPARFDLSRLALTLDPPEDGATDPPVQSGLDVVNWVNSFTPLLNGAPLPLWRYEPSRSLAVHPDGARFVLGTDWSLRAFDADGELLWQKSAPSVVWAANITGDGRYAVAAYGDGTIRWHRMEDGVELLAFFPLLDGENWVAWTPEGVYAATPGAHGVLQWRVNHGWDQAAEAIPAREIPETFRPQVIRHVLNEGGTYDAVAVVEMAKIKTAIKRRLKTDIIPGAQMHILTVGVSDYGDQARHLRLEYADDDARDVAAALAATQSGLYSKVTVSALIDAKANKLKILEGLRTVRTHMERNPADDLAVIQFSGHGTMLEGEFYLLPHGADVRTADTLIDSALSATALKREIAKIADEGRVLVLLDACRSGALLDGSGFEADANALREALRGPNVTVLTSSAGSELSREDPAWKNGAFTEALLGGLLAGDGDGNGVLSVPELTGHLKEKLAALTSGAQSLGVDMRFQSSLFAMGLKEGGTWKLKE